MKTTKTPLSIRIIYWVLNIFFYILILASIISLVDTIKVYAAYHVHGAFMDATFPITIKILDPGRLHIGNQNFQLKLTDAIAKMSVGDAPNSIMKIIESGNLLFFLFFTYLTLTAKKFVKNVKMGETFTVKNINLLKKVSYVMAGLAILQLIYTEIIFRLYLAGHSEFTHIKLVNVNPVFFVHLLWSALLIWVLAHIFIVGLKLQKENDLTI